MVNDVFIPRGINVPALDRKRQWEFTPVAGIKVGDHLTGGDIFGVRARAVRQRRGGLGGMRAERAARRCAARVARGP